MNEIYIVDDFSSKIIERWMKLTYRRINQASF